MNRNILISLKLTVVLIILCSLVYPLLVALVSRLARGGGGGEKLTTNGRVVGYANIGQKFTDDKYFWGRPSAVDYNAAGSGGSNKAASNTDYLKTVEARIDSFLTHNPGVTKSQIPADMVTASGSGIDPDISPEGALIQVKRIARVRKISEGEVMALVVAHIETSVFGPAKVNVLKLNVALDHLR